VVQARGRLDTKHKRWQAFFIMECSMITPPMNSFPYLVKPEVLNARFL
jgi:hypothetical protein